MPQRFISWSAAIRDIQSDRIQFASGERQAICRQQAFVEAAFLRAQWSRRVRPLVASGAYDRRAIMHSAVIAARARREVTGEAWLVCISAALKGTWQAAKAARRWTERPGSDRGRRVPETSNCYMPQSSGALAREDAASSCEAPAPSQLPLKLLKRRSRPKIHPRTAEHSPLLSCANRDATQALR